MKDYLCLYRCRVEARVDLVSDVADMGEKLLHFLKAGVLQSKNSASAADQVVEAAAEPPPVKMIFRDVALVDVLKDWEQTWVELVCSLQVEALQ
jgi:hypothetical protein